MGLLMLLARSLEGSHEHDLLSETLVQNWEGHAVEDWRLDQFKQQRQKSMPTYKAKQQYKEPLQCLWSAFVVSKESNRPHLFWGWTVSRLQFVLLYYYWCSFVMTWKILQKVTATVFFHIVRRCNSCHFRKNILPCSTGVLIFFSLTCICLCI